MIFANPLGLLGLLCLPVILGLHLVRWKQRRYIVPHLALWSFLDHQVSGPRMRRLPVTWILLLDLAIGGLLSLAWSEPRLSIHLPALSPRDLVILVDVSTSMRAGEGSQSRLTQAKTEVTSLLRNSRDVVTILSFGSQAGLIADSRQVGFSRLVDQVNAIQAGETGSAAFAEALALGQASLDQSLPAEFHIVTDGNFPQKDLGDAAAFAYPLHWHLVGDSLDNQAVIELNTFASPENQQEVFARFANFSDRPISRQAALSVDGKIVDQATIDLPAQASLPRVWQIPSSRQSGAGPDEITVSLLGNDALPADDQASTGLHAGGNIHVALVADQPAAIRQALQAVPGVDLTVFTPKDYPGQASGRTFDLTVFQNYLPEAWPGGQTLVLEPPVPSAGGSNPLAASLAPVAEIDIPADLGAQAPDPSPLVDGIDFSGVRWAKAWTLAGMPTGFTPLLQAGDVPLLLQGAAATQAGQFSQVTVLLADLSQGNFTRHPSFPIWIANLVENARQAPVPPAFKTGSAVPLPVTGEYQSIQVTPPKLDPVELNRDWPAEWTQTLDPGLYRFRLVRSGGSAVTFSAGANAGDEAESDLRRPDWAQSIADNRNSGPGGILQNSPPIDLRPWLLGAVILILLGEAVLAWRR